MSEQISAHDLLNSYGVPQVLKLYVEELHKELAALRTENESIKRIEAQNDIDIARLIEKLNYYEGHIGTHGEGCYKWGRSHYECALAIIDQLQSEAAAKDKEIAEANARIAEIESNVIYLIWDNWESSWGEGSKAQFDKADEDNRWKLYNAEALSNKSTRLEKHDAEVRSLALLEAAEKYLDDDGDRLMNEYVAEFLRRMAQGVKE
jgi:hypothetical protein